MECESLESRFLLSAVLASGQVEGDTLGTGSISGTLFYDTNANGQRDSGESGIANIRIYLDANNNGQLDSGESSTITNAAGNFTFSNLTAGTYILRQVIPYGEIQTLPAAGLGHHVTLAPGQNLGGEDFADGPIPITTASISGTVTNGSGGLDNFEVYLDANNNSVPDPNELSTFTNSSGAYSFTDVPPGAYIVRQVLPANDTQISPAHGYGHHITLAAAQAITNQNFTDDAAPSPEGEITGTIKCGGTPISAVEVYLDLNNNGIADQTDWETSTDNSGNYSFAGLSPGIYIVRQILPPGYTQTSPAGGLGHHVALAMDQSVTGEDFSDSSPSPGSISGLATPGVTIFLDANNNSMLDPGELRTVSDANGDYSFTNVAPGSYVVRQILPPGDTQTVPADGYGDHITLAAGQFIDTANFTDHISESDSISGEITINSVGAQGATVYLDANNNSKQDLDEFSATTDSSGYYLFVNIPDGSYIIRQIVPAGDTQMTPADNDGIHIRIADSGSLIVENFTDLAGGIDAAASVFGDVALVGD